MRILLWDMQYHFNLVFFNFLLIDCLYWLWNTAWSTYFNRPVVAVKPNSTNASLFVCIKRIVGCDQHFYSSYVVSRSTKISPPFGGHGLCPVGLNFSTEVKHWLGYVNACTQLYVRGRGLRYCKFSPVCVILSLWEQANSSALQTLFIVFMAFYFDSLKKTKN